MLPLRRLNSFIHSFIYSLKLMAFFPFKISVLHIYDFSSSICDFMCRCPLMLIQLCIHSKERKAGGDVGIVGGSQRFKEMKKKGEGESEHQRDIVREESQTILVRHIGAAPFFLS